MKRMIPLLIVMILGFIFVVHVFVPHQISKDFYDWYIQWVKVITPFAAALGVGSLVMTHTAKIKRKVSGFGYSYVTLISLVVVMASGFIWGIGEGTPFMWIFRNMNMPLGATMFSLLAFYMASAAYKAFRARSTEATVLLIAAIIVMLGRVSIGNAISPWIPKATKWILNVPNLAQQRGILLGVGLGMTATALKIILGIERTYLGGGK